MPERRRYLDVPKRQAGTPLFAQPETAYWRARALEAESVEDDLRKRIDNLVKGYNNVLKEAKKEERKIPEYAIGIVKMGIYILTHDMPTPFWVKEDKDKNNR